MTAATDVALADIEAMRELEWLRWGDGPPDVCPQCLRPGRCYFLNPANSISRRTRTGSMSQRRVWKCGHCRKQFSVWTGSVLARTKVQPMQWFLGLVLLHEHPEREVTVEMVQEQTGVARRHTAFRMWFLLTHAPADDPIVGIFRNSLDTTQHALDQLVRDGKVVAAYQKADS
jgi:hypothetical protein